MNKVIIAARQRFPRWWPHPGVVGDELLALVTGVGEEAVVAGDAVGVVVRLDVLAAVQRLLAVVAVEAVGHLGSS